MAKSKTTRRRCPRCHHKVKDLGRHLYIHHGVALDNRTVVDRPERVALRKKKGMNPTFFRRLLEQLF
ncbi:MAG: hypothetical protein ACF8XB_20950 [Planctomycetota bacterium JB042]